VSYGGGGWVGFVGAAKFFVGLGVGQRRGQTDGSEGQMGDKGWVPCPPRRVWGGEILLWIELGPEHVLSHRE